MYPRKCTPGSPCRWTLWSASSRAGRSSFKIARTMLVATGFNAPRHWSRGIRGETGWLEGLAATAAVVCDAATAPYLPARVRAVEFRLVSDATLDQLRAVEEGHRDPFGDSMTA